MTKTFDLKDFTSIALTGSGDVEFTQDSVFHVEVEAAEETMKGVKVEVKDGVLFIHYKHESKPQDKNVVELFAYHDGGYKVKVSAPTIDSLSVVGSGDVTIRSALNVEDLDISISGSGDVEAKKAVAADNVKLAIAGSGDMELGTVTTRSLEANVAGSGDVSLTVAKAEDVMLNVVGSGDMDVRLVDCGKLNASVSGSGDITVKGNVRELTRSKRGVDDSELKVGK